MSALRRPVPPALVAGYTGAAILIGAALAITLNAHVRALGRVRWELLALATVPLGAWALRSRIVPGWKRLEPRHRAPFAIAVAVFAGWCSLIAPLREQPLTAVLAIADGVSTLAIFGAVAIALVTRETGSAPAPPGSEWLGHWALCAGVWSLYLVMFWPATMSVDSVVQWAEMTTGHWSNGHPVAHTLTNWLITRLWLSPAAVAIAQIAGLASAVAFALHELALWGCSLRARWLAAVLIAVSPINGLLVVMLWKDIAYAIGFLFLSALTARLARTGGKSLLSARFCLGYAASALAVSFYRHNGPPVVLVLLAVAVVCVPRGLRRRWLMLAASILAAYLAIGATLRSALHVEPAPAYYLYAIPIHQIAAVVSHDPPTDPGLISELEHLEPVSILRDAYTCGSVNSVTIGVPVNDAFLSAPGHRLARLWWKVVSAHLEVLWERQVCITSILWRVPAPWVYTTTLEIADNSSGLEQQPLLPGVHAWFMRAAAPFLMSDSQRWWAWSPALPLYLALAMTLLAAYRNRSWRLLMWLVPLVLHTGLLLLVIVAADFRYQYPAYLLGLMSISWPSVTRRVADAQATGGVDSSATPAPGGEGCGSPEGRAHCSGSARFLRRAAPRRH